MQTKLKTSSNIGRDKSFVDDLNKERGIVRMRVAFVPRSAEIQPLFWRFVTFIPPPKLKLKQINNLFWTGSPTPSPNSLSISNIIFLYNDSFHYVKGILADLTQQFFSSLVNFRRGPVVRNSLTEPIFQSKDIFFAKRQSARKLVYRIN